ncbi:MAG: type II toxin-antitoxin system HicB family antitoxin [Candidatus Doudnabacteria bacterium]|nr:type II toxin-antitoxin system HicB family antitoxin [Candidatus Doudnabacteria bacterium]
MELQAHLLVQIFKQGKEYVAYTPVLDLSTSGKTRAQAKRMFAEAVQIFFEELERMGTLNEVLTDLGWVKTGTRNWHAPQVLKQAFKIKFPMSV